MGSKNPDTDSSWYNQERSDIWAGSPGASVSPGGEERHPGQAQAQKHHRAMHSREDALTQATGFRKMLHQGLFPLNRCSLIWSSQADCKRVGSNLDSQCSSWSHCSNCSLQDPLTCQFQNSSAHSWLYHWSNHLFPLTLGGGVLSPPNLLILVS